MKTPNITHKNSENNLVKFGFLEETVRFYHFRDRNGREADLVIEKEDGSIIGVEVKASQSVRPEDFSGLSILAHYAKDRFSHGVLFYSGDKILPFTFSGIRFHALPLSLLWS